MAIEKYVMTGKIKNFETPTSHLNSTPDEGRLRLEIKSGSNLLALECFVHGEDPYNLHSGSYRTNDLVHVRLTLLPYVGEVHKAVRQPKAIHQKGNIDYSVIGEIVEISDHPSLEMQSDYVRAILDCGVHIWADVVKDLGLKVGDYLSLVGRLDAHIIGKVI